MSATPPVRKQSSRRTLAGSLLRLLLLVFLLLVLLVAWLPVLLPTLLERQGISLQWQQPRWSWHGLQLKQLDLSSGPHQLQAHDLQLGWRWHKYPWQSLEIGRLQIRSALPDSSNASAGSDADFAAIMPWLPHQIRIRQLDADISGAALITGSINLQAGAGRPLWQPDQFELDLALSRLHPNWLVGIPQELQPDSLHIRILPHPDATAAGQDAIQVLALDLHSRGKTQIQLSGIFTLLQHNGWLGRLEQARLHLNMPRLQLGGLQLEQVRGQLYFSAEADEQGARLQLDQPASLSIARLLAGPGTSLQQVSVTLSQWQLTASQPHAPIVELGGNYHVSARRLLHPLLRAQTWSASGKMTGTLPQLEVAADITNTAGLQLASSWSWRNRQLDGKLGLADIYIRAGNPLQATLQDWPPLINLNNGRLSASADIRLPAGQPLQVLGWARASGVSGLVDLSRLQGLDFNADFRLDNGGQLQLDIPRLMIAELDPGVPVQQLIVQDARYSGRIDRLLQGSLRWQSLRGQLLGGSFSLPTSSIQLSAQNRLQLQLSGIELHEILARYPAEGLYGQGTIDGTLPLLVGPQGVFVERGNLQARAPGQLRLQSDKIRALGRANPAMQQVTDALDDFHFNLLSSALNYEPSGKLMLNIRLEGKNPAVENGRPIHLSVNLEEDLPALLTSIQLGGQISETLRQRIHQRLQKR